MLTGLLRSLHPRPQKVQSTKISSRAGAGLCLFETIGSTAKTTTGDE